MKFLPLIVANLGRKKSRTLFTALSILVAFLLYGYLAAVGLAFQLGISLTGNDRLVLRHKVSLVQLLPESYQARLEKMPGVVAVAHATFFGGVYKDPQNFFSQLAVEPERFLALYPEYVLPPEQRAAWLRNRVGAVAGRELADKYGWKVGDRIPLQASIWQPKDGTGTWELELVGIYDGAEAGTDTSQFLFRYDFFDENRVEANGLVGWYVLRVDDAERAPAIARQVDEAFANSSYDDRATTEKAFVQAVVRQVGDVGKILTGILGSVFFTILLVAVNTMIQSVRERANEIAVLKTLGFLNGQVLALVLAESSFLAAAGGLAGLGLAWLLIGQGDPTGGALPRFVLEGKAVLLGCLYIALLGLCAGLLPALWAIRLRISEALRRA